MADALHTPADVFHQLPQLMDSMVQACHWLVDKAQIQTHDLPEGIYRHARQGVDWRGAFWGEYRVATGRWNFMCPIWHGGQAVKALAMACQVLEEPRLLQAATNGASFILRNQRKQGVDAGVVLAYEDHEDKVNTSAVLETLDGWFVLSDVTGDPLWRDAAVAAGRWALDHAWVKGQGIVLDLYDPANHQFLNPAYVTLSSYPGRPLADDAIWLTCHRVTGEPRFREAFYDVLHCLLRTEDPAGNWVGYGPCQPRLREIHPRHAYWWGMPMLAAWRECGEQKYLDAAYRSGQWYINAQRTDGGLFRYTNDQFNTASFGHATSGIACAAIFWLELWQATGEDRWLLPVYKALNYAMGMQFTCPADENLKGCILEKILPPDGSDASPYHIRDLATIFFIQAAAKLARLVGEKPSAGVADVLERVDLK